MRPKLQRIEGQLGSEHHLIPEGRLILAVILQAIDDAAFCAPRPRTRKMLVKWKKRTAEAKQARAWLEDHSFVEMLRLLPIQPHVIVRIASHFGAMPDARQAA